MNQSDKARMITIKIVFNNQPRSLTLDPESSSLSELKLRVLGEFPALIGHDFDLYSFDGKCTALLSNPYLQLKGDVSGLIIVAAIKVSECIPQLGFPHKLFSSIAREEIASRKHELAEAVSQELVKSLPQNKDPDWELVARRRCSACGAEPIVGAVFVCAQCLAPNVIVCERCEARGLHSHHALLKLKNERQIMELLRRVLIPRSQIVPEEEKKVPGKPAPISQLFVKPEEEKSLASGVRDLLQSAKKWIQTKLRRYPKSMLVSLDGYSRAIAGEPGDTVFAYWSVQNRSDHPWPAPVFVHLDAAGLIFEWVNLGNVSVEPGQTFDFAIPVMAPASEGEYDIKATVNDMFREKVGKALKIRLSVRKVPAAGNVGVGPKVPEEKAE